MCVCVGVCVCVLSYANRCVNVCVWVYVKDLLSTCLSIDLSINLYDMYPSLFMYAVRMYYICDMYVDADLSREKEIQQFIDCVHLHPSTV